MFVVPNFGVIRFPSSANYYLRCGIRKRKTHSAYFFITSTGRVCYDNNLFDVTLFFMIVSSVGNTHRRNSKIMIDGDYDVIIFRCKTSHTWS